MHKKYFTYYTSAAVAALIGTGAIAQTAPAANHDAPSNPAVDTSSTDKSQAPATGSNSFTETQAQSRLAKHGYTDVTGLMKDENGVWRGKAKSKGKSVAVALDYKGDITAK
jgi:hypothetical protein